MTDQGDAMRVMTEAEMIEELEHKYRKKATSVVADQIKWLLSFIRARDAKITTLLALNERLTETLFDVEAIIVAADSITSLVAHRVNRAHLGDENRRELLAVSGRCRTITARIAALTQTKEEKP